MKASGSAVGIIQSLVMNKKDHGGEDLTLIGGEKKMFEASRNQKITHLAIIIRGVRVEALPASGCKMQINKFFQSGLTVVFVYLNTVFLG